MNIKNIKQLFVYWPKKVGILTLFSLLALLILLPHKIRLAIGRFGGLLIYYTSKKTRNVTTKNINLCFPALTVQQKEKLIKDNFRSLGMAFIEAGMAWFLPDYRIKNLYSFSGIEHLQKAQGKGILFLSLHLTSVEFTGRCATRHLPFSAVYQPVKNKIIDTVIKTKRKAYLTHLVPNYNVRAIIKILKNNGMIWFAPDQAPKKKHQIYAPFFDISTASSTATNTLVNLSQAMVFPISCFRKPDYSSYDIVIYPPLEDFPSADIQADTTRINKIFEDIIKQHPEQYLWQYKRFKNSAINSKHFRY